MKIKFTPFTPSELNEPTTFVIGSIAHKFCIGKLIHVYHLNSHDAKAIADDCCLTGKPLMSHLGPLMESNPELFI